MSEQMTSMSKVTQNKYVEPVPNVQSGQSNAHLSNVVTKNNVPTHSLSLKGNQNRNHRICSGISDSYQLFLSVQNDVVNHRKCYVAITRVNWRISEWFADLKNQAETQRKLHLFFIPLKNFTKDVVSFNPCKIPSMNLASKRCNVNQLQIIKENAGFIDILSHIYCTDYYGTTKYHHLDLHDYVLVAVKQVKWKSYNFLKYLNGIQFIQIPMSYRDKKLKKNSMLNRLNPRSIIVTSYAGCISQYFSLHFSISLNYGLSENFMTAISFCLLKILHQTQFPSHMSMAFYYFDEIVPLNLTIFLFELDDFCLLACLAIIVAKLSNTVYAIFICLSSIEVQDVDMQKPPCSKRFKTELLTNKRIVWQLNCDTNMRLCSKVCYKVKKLFPLELKLDSSQHKVLPVKLPSMYYIKSNLYSRNISSRILRKSLIENRNLISYKMDVQVEILSFEYCTQETEMSTLESQGFGKSCLFRSQYRRSYREIVANDINYPLPFSSEGISTTGYSNYPDTPQNEIYYSIDSSFALGVCEKTMHKTFLPCNMSHQLCELVPCLITCEYEWNLDAEIVSDKRHVVIHDTTSEYRATNNQQVKDEMGRSLQGNTPASFTEKGLLGASSLPLAKTNKANSHKHLPPNIQAESQTQLDIRPGNVAADLNSQQLTSNVVGATGYTIDRLPDVPPTLHQYYGTDFDAEKPLSKEEKRKDVQVVPKEKDVDTILQSHHKDETASKKLSSELQATAKPSTKPRTSANVDRPPRFPRKACVVYKNEQYSLDPKLLPLPRATKYLVKVRTEISPGRFMAKLELHCASEDEKLPNLDVTAATSNEQVVPVRERKHFRSNIDKTGYVIFSSDLESFSGHIQYPLPNKRATASRIGYGGNAIVFVVFHAGKEFAVKKTVYRSKEISVHSQLCHPNIINLEAVLVGEKHERHRDKYYVYCFMQKMDINFRNVLSTKDHGCLKHLKMKLVEKRDQWETVLLNVKHVLRSVLKALDYMHGQGLVHRDVKASNILIKTTCQCSEVLYCSCQHKFIVQLGDFDSSATVPGYQLHLEEHQMIRYASVLPLGTMGYRAPEVSMHLVLSGPYEVLYTTGVDIWSFGCLLLAIFIGKSGPLKQRGL
ncbi:uncharacterized protein [Dysidea avara]|uniref:uncharacterized protein isoform X2 n=1 Tax=Dysidea avara TaxID=196820 RepID=UPI0033330F4F